MRSKRTGNHRRILTTGPVLGAAFCLWMIGCDFGGYNDLGSKLDLLEPISTEDVTGWMRTLSGGETEFLTLGGADSEGRGAFAYVTVDRDSVCTILVGDYLEDGDMFTFTSMLRYHNPNETEKPPASRIGSQRTELNPADVAEYKLQVADETLTISNAFFTNRFTELHSVIRQLDLSTNEGVTLLARFYNLTVITLQTRIPDYGGAGMLQYAGETSDFVGILDGAGAIGLSAIVSPKTTLSFNEMVDFPGITLDGSHVSETNLEGDGDLTGTIGFNMVDPADDSTSPIVGSVEYQIDLDGGATSGGVYIVTIDGQGTTELSFEALEDLDFRDALAP